MDGWMDGQIGRWVGRQVGKSIGRWIGRYVGKLVNRQVPENYIHTVRAGLATYRKPRFTFTFLYPFPRYYTYAQINDIYTGAIRLFYFDDLHDYSSLITQQRTCVILLLSFTLSLFRFLFSYLPPTNALLFHLSIFLLSPPPPPPPIVPLLSLSSFRKNYVLKIFYLFLSFSLFRLLYAIKRNIKLSIKRLRKNLMDYRRAPRFVPLARSAFLWNL